MCSSTFQRVQENADQIWKFQRYKLVYEYVGAPIFPPPLCYISYIYSAYEHVRVGLRQKQESKQKEAEPELPNKWELIEG